MKNYKVSINGKIKVNFEVIIKKLHEVSKINENGEVLVSAFEAEEITWVILPCLKFNFEISEHNISSLCWEVLKEIVRKKLFTENDFLKIFNEKIKIKYKNKLKEFHLLASLTIDYLPIRKVTISNCEIKIVGKKFPKKYIQSRNKHYTQDVFNDKDYLKLIIITKDLNAYDAFERMEKILNVLKALISFEVNYTLGIHSGPFNRINKVVFGNLFTMHHPNGTSNNDNSYWFNQNLKLKVLKVRDSHKERFKLNLKYSLKKINKCQPKHQNTIFNALNIYTKAFDEENPYSCYLQAWTALEVLNETDSNDVLIKRFSMLYYNENERKYQKQILESLRGYRNNIVHNGNNNLVPFVLSYQCQKYLMNLLFLYHFPLAGKITSVDYVNRILDQKSKSIKDLKKELEINKKVIAMKLKHEKNHPNS